MPRTKPADIRDLGTITHKDVLGLNFIRKPSPYYFRGHFREGLRSRIIQVLDPRDVRAETGGVMHAGIRRYPLARPLRMMIIADPTGDLKGAYAEGSQIRDHMAQYKNIINVTLRSQDMTSSFLKKKMKFFDMIHFAGHADYDKDSPEKNGWRLAESSLSARDIMNLTGSVMMPTLIFSNACQSARTEEWTLEDQYQNEIFGLANAFLLAGVKHYVGTFWEILDEFSSRFALEFYRQLFSGKTTGEALRDSRRYLIQEYGEENIVWASYLLYGDPTSNYTDQIELAEPEEEQAMEGVATSDARIRSLEVEQRVASEEVSKKYRTWWSVAAGAGIALLILILFMVMRIGREKQGPRNLALTPGAIPHQTQIGTTDPDFQKTVQIIHLLSSYHDQLHARFKEKGFFTQAKDSDLWTSEPMNICMISPNWEKLPSETAGSVKPQFEVLFKRMTEAFTQTRSLGLSILERERLNMILQELQLGIPNLSGDSLQDAYDILSARVILFPEPVTYPLPDGIQSEASLRMVETESTRIISAFSEAFSPETASVQEAVSKLVQKTIRTLEEKYPLQGRIITLDGQTVEINLGSSVGVSQAQSFSVFGQSEKDLPKGKIQIKTVYEHTALAKVLAQDRQFKTGDRIRATH